MAEPVELSVRSELKKIIVELEAIASKADTVGDGLGKAGQKISDELNKQTKRTETFLTRLRSLGTRVSGQLKDDFRSLLSLNALKESLSLSENFKGTIKQGLELTDTIRKFGRTLGVADSNWARFQTNLVKGLGEIGLGSEVATDNIKALANSPVRGEANILGYSKVSGQMASATGARGSEGQISALIAKVIQAQGGNPNDLRNVNRVGADATRVFQQTGASAVDSLTSMSDILSSMPKDLRKVVSTSQLAQLAAAAQVAGPGSTKFLQEFLGKSPMERMAMEHLGLGGVFGKNGINVDRLGSGLQGALGRVGFDPEASAKILGLSPEAANGAVRFAQAIDKAKEAMRGVVAQSGDFAKLKKDSMGIGEALGASVNQVKALVSPITSRLGHGAAKILSKASESPLGAAAVVAGGGLLASTLAGVGLGGIGRALGMGKAASLAEAAAVENATGRQVVPVYVTNPEEIGGGLAGGGLGALGKAGLLGGALTAGLATGYAIDKAGYNPLSWKPIEDLIGKAVDKMGKATGVIPQVNQPATAVVEHRIKLDKGLKEVRPATRGSENAPVR